MARIAASLLLIVLLAACGSSGATVATVAPSSSSTTQPAPAEPTTPSAVQSKLRSALDAWATFPANAPTRPLVLTSDPVSAPAGGFRTGDLKEAFMSATFTAPASLPTEGPSANGYPVITAAQALDLWRAEGSPALPQANVPPLVITGVRFSESSFATDRGTRTLPAWLFTFADVQSPAAVLAVAPSSQFAAPEPSPASVGARVDPDGRTVTVRFPGAMAGIGSCGADYTVFQAASEKAVALFVKETMHPITANISCAAVAYPRSESITLAAPLGGRVLVDAKTTGAVQIAP